MKLGRLIELLLPNNPMCFFLGGGGRRDNGFWQENAVAKLPLKQMFEG